MEYTSGAAVLDCPPLPPLPPLPPSRYVCTGIQCFFPCFFISLAAPLLPIFTRFSCISVQTNILRIAETCQTCPGHCQTDQHPGWADGQSRRRGRQAQEVARMEGREGGNGAPSGPSCGDDHAAAPPRAAAAPATPEHMLACKRKGDGESVGSLVQAAASRGHQTSTGV